MTAPAFALGPEAGRVLALLLLFGLHFFLTWLCHLRWRDRKVSGLPVGPAFLLFPWIGIAGAYIQKFIPDYLAMVLVLGGVSFLWDAKRSRKDTLFGAAAIAIGLLVKPTAITVLALLLLREEGVGLRWTDWVRRARGLFSVVPALALAVLPAGLYYTLGIRFLETLQESRGLFAVKARDPLWSLFRFFTAPSKVFELLFKDLLFPGAPLVLLGVFLLARAPERRRLALWSGVLMLQVVGIALLDGRHSFNHSYYHIGTAPTVALLVWQSFQVILSRRDVLSSAGARMQRGTVWVAATMGLLLASHAFGLFASQFRSLVPGSENRFIWPSEFRELRERRPEFPWGRGQVFRSPKFPVYPEMGLGFGEREGALTGEFGFSRRNAVWPPQCRRVDETRHLALVRCAPSNAR
jgi:hypothetical protein